MKTEEIVSELEKLAPLSIQESWDNSGLQIKSHDENIKSIALTLDITIDSLNFAKENNCNLIISHHPLFFSKFKNLSIDSYIGRIIKECFDSKINIVSFHTNIDTANGGLADFVSKKLELKNITSLEKKNIKKFKIVTFIPEDYLEKFLQYFIDKEVSIIGNYKACSFYNSGKGTFYPMANSSPFIGEKEQLNKIPEYKLEFYANELELGNIIKEIYKLHPYEMPAIDVFQNFFNGNNNKIGFGRGGFLKSEMNFEKFLEFLSKKLNIKNLRYVKINNNKIKKIAICPGSGMSLIEEVKKFSPDVYITGDMKYHEAFMIKEQKLFNLVDIGHFESEIFFVELMNDYLKNKVDLPIFIYNQKSVFEYF